VPANQNHDISESIMYKKTQHIITLNVFLFLFLSSLL